MTSPEDRPIAATDPVDPRDLSPSSIAVPRSAKLLRLLRWVAALLLPAGFPAWIILSRYADIRACEEGGGAAVTRCLGACRHFVSPHIPSCTRAGVAFVTGEDGLTRDDRRAVALFQRACDGRDMFGCIQLGVAFEHGKGVPAKDEARAAELYQRACDGGSMLGCSFLGVALDIGRGLAQDQKKAVALYQTTCDGG